jgi:cytochrome oxidase Cu insertion factor (SCO1/SenC/PrrC family)
MNCLARPLTPANVGFALHSTALRRILPVGPGIHNEIPVTSAVEKQTNPQEPVSSLRNRWLLLATASIGVALVAAGLLGIAMVSKRAVNTPAPGFLLRDQQSRLTSLSQFRGKVVVLTFIDPECTQICPLTTQSMVEALKILGPPAASQVQLLGVDANPQKTEITDVAAYTSSHKLEGRWRFLTGSRAQLQSVWRSYHVYVAAEKDDIEHDAVVFLIDGSGNEREVYSTPMSYQAVGDQARTLAEGIARLLPGHPAISVSSQATQEQEEPLKPDETFSLTATGPKQQRVVLGGAHPHLVLFFAGWLAQGSELSKDLATLDSYAAMARRQAWPSPVAVDELTTEASPPETRQALALLAVKLRTPIVEDANGRVADGYHVEDLPWFVLNSPSGTILWSHAGWLSAAALNRQVSGALRRTPMTR